MVKKIKQWWYRVSGREVRDIQRECKEIMRRMDSRERDLDPLKEPPVEPGVLRESTQDTLRRHREYRGQ